MPIDKVLLPEHGTITPEVCHVVWAMHDGVTNRKKIMHQALKNPGEDITEPEFALQVRLVPVLPLSGGYRNVVEAMDVFSR